MTCIELLAKQHPEDLSETELCGARYCPHHYGYALQPSNCFGSGSNFQCKKCWEREIITMTKDQAIHFMLHNSLVKVRHELFDCSEYLYSKGDGVIYDEAGYVFEDFSTHCDGMRLRTEPVWLTGWSVLE